MTRPLALSHGNPSSPTLRPVPRHPVIRRRILYAHHTTAPCIVADLIDSQGLQVSKSLDAASRRPRRSQVSELGRHLRGPRKRRMRGVSKRGCNTCAVTGFQTNNVGVMVRYYMLEWCGEGHGLSAMVWFASEARYCSHGMRRDFSCSSPASKSRVETARAKTPTYAECHRKSGMRHETTVVRRRSMACMRLYAQKRNEKDQKSTQNRQRVMRSFFQTLYAEGCRAG